MAKSYLSIVLLLAQLLSFALGQPGQPEPQPALIEVFRWMLPYNGPQEWVANVGDTMIFRWRNGRHNVYIHPSMSCEQEGSILVGAQGGSSYTFTEADGSPEGKDMFFACDIGDGAHCRNGQFLTVTVYDSGAASGVAPTIIPTTIAPTTVNGTEVDVPAEVDVPVTLPEDISNETLAELDDIETMLELDDNATLLEDDDNTTIADEPEETPEETEADPTQINAVEAASSGRTNSVSSALFLLGASLMLLVV